MNTTGETPHWLDAYHFYEQEWEDYSELSGQFEWEIPDTFNIATYICDRWARDRGRVALFAEDESGTERTFTYRQLRNVANGMANYLLSIGIEPGDRVGVCSPPKPEAAIAHIAIWKIGGVTVPLSTLFGPDALEYRIQDCDIKATIVDTSNIDSYRQVAADSNSPSTVTIDVDDSHPGARDFHAVIQEFSTEFETTKTNPEDDAFIIYTSGTTGDPKGVRHAHRSLLGHLPVYLTTFCNMDLAPSDLHWCPSEWAWVAPLFDTLFPSLYYGNPVLAYEKDGPFDAETAFSLIEEYSVTNLLIPTTAIRMMMQVDSPGDRYDLAAMRVLVSGGLDDQLVEWSKETFPNAVIHEAYGQTEANIVAGECASLMEQRDSAFGKAGPGHEIRVVDPETGELVTEPGDVGELAVKYENDPVCFKGYWGNLDKTEQKIQNGWLLTEDLGWRDADGYLYFKSRKDDVILSSGYRIGPEEVEESLTDHPAVVEAGVVGTSHEQRGTVSKGFVELADDVQPSAGLRDTLKQHVKDNLAKYKYPREIEFTDELPKTRTGKVKRDELRDNKN